MSTAKIRHCEAFGGGQPDARISALADEPTGYAMVRLRRDPDRADGDGLAKTTASTGYSERERMSFVTMRPETLTAVQFAAHAQMFRQLRGAIYGDQGGQNGRRRAKGGLR
jgi:hypothetical protein